tara:strand:+ start:559 stop:864 length:306 start_codon:yes stop_codon:yes gene_type:complete
MENTPMINYKNKDLKVFLEDSEVARKARKIILESIINQKSYTRMMLDLIRDKLIENEKQCSLKDVRKFKSNIKNIDFESVDEEQWITSLLDMYEKDLLKEL